MLKPRTTKIIIIRLSGIRLLRFSREPQTSLSLTRGVPRPVRSFLHSDLGLPLVFLQGAQPSSTASFRHKGAVALFQVPQGRLDLVCCSVYNKHHQQKNRRSPETEIQLNCQTVKTRRPYLATSCRQTKHSEAFAGDDPLRFS